MRRLIAAGRLGEARIELDQVDDATPELIELVRLELRVKAREIEPSTALARIVAVLERADDFSTATTELWVAIERA